MNGCGALRDTLGAVFNLLQLLRSRSVAPRAITAVLPDVHDGCGQLLTELEQLENELGRATSAEAAQELFRFISGHVQVLADATKPQPKMTAGSRLRLERSVAKIERGLAGGLAAAELMSEAREPNTHPYDVLELLRLRRSGDQPEPHSASPVKAVLRSSLDSAMTKCHPRLIWGLIALSATLLRQGESSPEVLAIGIEAIAADPASVNQPGPKLELSVSVEVAPNEQTSPDVQPVLELLVPPTTPCGSTTLSAVARACGLDNSTTDERVRFRWQPS